MFENYRRFKFVAAFSLFAVTALVCYCFDSYVRVVGRERTSAASETDIASRIRLVADGPERMSIEFILDCSQSMDQQTFVRRKLKGKGPTAKRIDLVKQQSKTILDELVAQNQNAETVRVGMRFFGHRVAWNAGMPPAEMVIHPAYKKDAAALRKLGPSRDVERALQVGRFDDTINESIKRRISALEPWGETPLYLALTQALADFKDEPAESRKFIIAITDGANQQSQPDTFAEDVLNAWKKSPVPIYILGFDMPKAQGRQVADELVKLTGATGGKFFPVESGSELLDALRQSLSSGRKSK